MVKYFIPTRKLDYSNVELENTNRIQYFDYILEEVILCEKIHCDKPPSLNLFTSIYYVIEYTHWLDNTHTKRIQKPHVATIKNTSFHLRLEWESAVLRGTTIFRRMEEDRLRQLQHLAEQYHQVTPFFTFYFHIHFYKGSTKHGKCWHTKVYPLFFQWWLV